jgi:hypothetical protein
MEVHPEENGCFEMLAQFFFYLVISVIGVALVLLL